jgi:hypothetical protein
MRLTIIIFSLVCGIFTSYADDLDIIADRKTTPDERGRAYDRLTNADFNLIAAKLAIMIGTHPVLTGIGPRTKEPWNETQLSEGDRIGCVLSQLWQCHVRPTNSREQYIGIMLTLLEDSSVEPGRQLVIGELTTLLHFGRQFSDTTLSWDTILPRLDRFARDLKQPNYFREKIVKVLFEHSDPNQYLDLAIELSSLENTPRSQADAFKLCTESFDKSKFSEANRKKYVKHCFELLEKADDGQNGIGVSLAMRVGEFLGIPPVRATEGSFAPDSQLKKYRDANGNIKQNFY